MASLTPPLIDPSPTVTPATDDDVRAIDGVQEFADVLDLCPRSLIQCLNAGTDKNNRRLDYDQLVNDPIKSFVAQNRTYFHDLKADSVLRLASTHLRGARIRDLRVLAPTVG